MSIDTVHEKRLLPTQQAPLQLIPAILICKNSLVRAGICHILDGTRFIVAGMDEGDLKRSALPDATPALYILDDSHAADELVGMVADLKAQYSPALVVVLADHLDPETMMRALQAGMNGLCSTRMERDALIKALELVMLGETFIPSAMALAVLDGISQSHESRQNIPATLKPANDTATKAHNLSSREAEILRRLMKGESNKVIARKLDIAEATIKVHIKAILRKVRAKNRTQAAIWATAHLSVSSPEDHGEDAGASACHKRDFDL